MISGLPDQPVLARIRRRSGYILVLGSLVAVLAELARDLRSHSTTEVRWVTRGFSDFSKGQLDASGANLYVSRKGTLQMIHQFDLNGDGFLDLLFNQSHDYNSRVDSAIYWNGDKGLQAARQTAVPADGGYKCLLSDLNGDGYMDLVVVNRFNGTTHRLHSYIYWGTPNGLDLAGRTSLPTLGATGAAAGDLNGDGFKDLVFSNGGSLEAFTVGKVDDRVSYIYWGGPYRYSASHRTEIPAVSPVAVAIVDLNADGFSDIVLANSGPESPGVFIYWGGPAGISISRRLTIPLGDVSSVVAADLNNDGFPELVVARKNAAASYVVWNQRGTLSLAESTQLPTLQAVAACVGDLNGDGFPDLAFANGGHGHGNRSVVYWGSQKGYDRTRSAFLETNGASGCAVAHFNQDARADLVFSQYQNEESYDVPSIVFWGGPTGFSADHATALPTHGATDVQAGDLNGDRLPDVIFANNIAGRTRGDINSYIYWGNATGDYSPQHRSELPGHSNYKACAADLNDDGYVDLVFANSWDDEPTGPGTAFIYWGGPAGFNSGRRQELTVGGVYGCSVADLNRDGYLDLVFSNYFTKEETVHQPRRDFGDKGGVIYWGSESGYSHGNRTLLSAPAPMGNRIADFNKDGYLDILFTTWQGGDPTIFWGSKEGFSDRNRSSVPGISSVNAEIADLNRDGYLDLILCNHIDSRTLRHNVPSFVYYGGPQGFSASNRIELPTWGAHDASVADLDQDGNLDIVFSNYHADERRDPPSYIYWGDRAGRYDPARRTELPTDSAAGNLVADLNGDGYYDIVFSNHFASGSHSTRSFIYWGSPSGFRPSKRTELPTIGPHNMFGVDIGNLYSRKLEEEYQSVPYQLKPGLRVERIEWQAETPGGTGVKFQIRVANSKGALEHAQWIGPKGQGTFWTNSGDRAAGMSSTATWVQYRAVLTTPNGGNTPRLHEVSVVFRE